VNEEEALSPEDISQWAQKLFSVFEAGGLRRILSYFEPLTPAQKTNVVLRVITIRHAASIRRKRVRAATHLFETGDSSSSLDEHRAKMGAIASHSKRLYSLLGGEVFFSDLFHSADSFPHVEIFIPREDDCGDRFLDDLERVCLWASAFHQHPHLLRDMRSAISGVDTTIRKNFERLQVWEPIFDLWLACGKRLGASRAGKVHEVQKIMHKALDLDDPNPETVYRAIRDFKNERRSHPENVRPSHPGK